MFFTDKQPKAPKVAYKEREQKQSRILDGVYGDAPFLIDLDADKESQDVFATHPAPLSFTAILLPSSEDRH